MCFSAAKMKLRGFYLRRDGEELSEIDMFDVRFSLLIIACSRDKNKQYLDFLITYLKKIPKKLWEMFEWAPLRSRSARMFIGPELSTHTISFKVSPQYECDALREKNSNHRLVIYMKTVFNTSVFLHSPDNCSQPWTKVQERVRSKRRIPLLYLKW